MKGGSMSKLRDLLICKGINPQLIADAIIDQRTFEIDQLNDKDSGYSDEEALEAVFTIDHLTEFLELLDVEVPERNGKEVKHVHV